MKRQTPARAALLACFLALPFMSQPSLAGTVTAPLIKAIRHADFNGDGRDDLLWHNGSPNRSAGWLMNGTQIQAGVILEYPPASDGFPDSAASDSYVVGATDLDRDGQTDLFWISPNKQEVYIAALMEGLQRRTSSGVASVFNKSFIDTGDFNGDGKGDLLFRASVGSYFVMLMDGTAPGMTGGDLHPDGLTDGQAVLVADLDGDGRDDIVFLNSDGSVVFCGMTGVDCGSSGFIRQSGNTFVPIAAGDFNGDGKMDIVWQAPDGTTSLWLMNGANQIDSVAILGPGTGWHVIAAPDMNGDGRADLLFAHDDGSSAGWLMNGTTPIAYKAFFGGGTGWHFAKAADLNGDRKDDLVWRHDDGSYGPWLMNGLDAFEYATFFGPDTGWEIIP